MSALLDEETVAVDHFAGVGWGVATHRLGVTEYGVDNAKAVIRTRTANGMRTIYRDVWAGLFHPWLVPTHKLYIASPPCPTFNMAGSGEGRESMPAVLSAIDDERWKDPASLHALTEMMDPRTALVLTPLAHIWAHRPELVALEQVPEVLPVWHAIARVLRTLGYSVWAGILRAEQYGVPQTRKRAILMARLDGKAEPPVPTHSRHYPENRNRLDPGVKRYITMAEALGWGMTDRPYPTIATSRTSGGPDKEKVGGSAARASIYAEKDAGRWVFERPATTVVGTFSPHIISAPGHREFKGTSRQDVDGSVRVSFEQAAALQSFPPDFIWKGTKTARFQIVGNAVPPLLAEAIIRSLLAAPAERDAWDLVFAEVAG